MRVASSILVGLAVMAGAAEGQSSTIAAGCSFALTTGCQAKVDVFDYLAPQLAGVVAGGNATLAQGGAMPGLGHVALSVRANALHGSLPDLRNFAPDFSGTRQKFDTKTSVLLLPAIDASIGVYGGYPVGVTKTGALDILVNATYVPSFNGGSTSLQLPDGALDYGYGARVGLLQEGLVTPGVGVTWVRHDLPRMNVRARAATTTLNIDDIDVRTTSWRVTANKSLLLFGIAAGIGQDRYRSSATINKTTGPSTSGPFTVSQQVTRMSYFADISTNVLLAKVVAEIGAVSGGKIETYNSFAGKAPDAFRLYGSLGVRVGI